MADPAAERRSHSRRRRSGGGRGAQLRRRTDVRILVLTAAAAFAGAMPAAAQTPLPVPRLETVFPAGVQRGATVEVGAEGVDLDGLSAMEFSAAGISAELVVPAVDEFGIPEQRESRTFRVTAAGDAPLGVAEVRVRGRFGWSNSVLFAIGSAPELVKSGAPHRPEDAMEVPLGAVVNGRMEDNLADWFVVNAPSGAAVTAALRAEAIDSPLDGVIHVLGTDLRELAAASDGVGVDSIAVFRVPDDGRFFVRIHDVGFDGSPASVYRLQAKLGVPVADVFPSAAVPGSSERFQVVRRTPEGERSGLEEIAIPEGDGERGAPPPDPLGAGERFHHFDGGFVCDAAPVGFPILLASDAAGLVIEREPNGRLGDGMPVKAPALIAGRFDGAGDRDRFRVSLRAGEAILCEVMSDRAGRPTDPAIQIYRVTASDDGSRSESRLGEADDVEVSLPALRRNPLRSRDAMYRLAPDQDGEFVIEVLDRSGIAGAGAAYTLSLKPQAPEFDLFTAVAPPVVEGQKSIPWPAALPCGGSIAIPVTALRREGFSNAIELQVSGLPEGVAAEPAVIADGQTNASIILRHDSAALGDGWTGPIEISGRAVGVEDDAPVRRASPITLRWRVEDASRQRAELRSSAPIVVHVEARDRAPLHAELEDAAPRTLVLGEKLELSFTIAAEGEIKDQIKVIAAGIPGVDRPPEVTIEADKRNGVIAFETAPSSERNFRPGSFPLVLRAEAKTVFRAAPEEADRWQSEAERMAGEVASIEAEIERLNGDIAAGEQAVAAATSSESPDQEGAGAAEADLASRRAEADAARQKLERARASKQRVDQFAKEAAERAKPNDRIAVAYSGAVMITLTKPAADEN